MRMIHDTDNEEVLVADVLAFVLLPPEHWERVEGIRVIDPDGWQRDTGDWASEWARPVTHADFMRRCDESTCMRFTSRTAALMTCRGNGFSLLETKRRKKRS